MDACLPYLLAAARGARSNNMCGLPDHRWKRRHRRPNGDPSGDDGSSARAPRPDENRSTTTINLTFVFRRLSIVDLATGSQPIGTRTPRLFVAVTAKSTTT